MSTVKVTNIQHGSATNVAMVLDSAGTVKAYSTIGVGNTTPAASGAGITFPASASASSDANTLDDYEEGTWTPTVVGETTPGTTTYSSRTGTYTKIGRQVTCCATIVYTATTGTGFMNVGGLPFTVAAPGGVAALEVSGLNWTGGTYLVLFANDGTTYCNVFGEADDADRTAQNITNETAVLRFTLTYFI